VNAPALTAALLALFLVALYAAEVMSVATEQGGLV